MSVPQDAKQPTAGGLQNHRIEFVREDEKGVTPTDPEWMLFSDVMREAWAWQPDASMEPQRGIGQVDPQDFFTGAEEHEVSFVYDWQRPWVSEGSPGGASYDFFFRAPDGTFNATHTVVGRESHADGGAAGAGFRTFTVGRGGHPSEAEAEEDPSEVQPTPMNLTYSFYTVRSYVIDQPSAATTLAVKSTDDADTTQSVTIENEGAGTTETVTLNGSTVVATTTEFGDIDAISLGTDAVGDVVVSVNDGGDTAPTEGTTLVEIAGKDTNSPAGSTQLSGDLGVPALGSGSHMSEVEAEGSRTYRHVRGGRIERMQPATADMGPRLNGLTLTAENNTETTERQKSTAMAIDRGVLNVTLEASIAGPKLPHGSIMDHLQNTRGTVEREYPNGNYFRIPAARVTEPGELADEAEQTSLYTDNTLQGEGFLLLDDTDSVIAGG